MALTIPDDLAPECYPLAWLVGQWRGFGQLTYPGIEESAFVHDLAVDHDGGPYLRLSSTIRLATGTVNPEQPGTAGADGLEAGQIWSTETQYWRPVPGAATATSSAEDGPDPTELEVLVANPAGHVSVYVGQVRGPRITLSTDAVVRTNSAAEMTGATMMYGLVQSDLMWAQDLAAFGQELQTYASGRLSRVEH